MLLSIALIILLALSLSKIFKMLSLPPIIGMLISGVILGPYVLNLIDDSILNISSELRQIALVIILVRAGLSLNIEDLKKVGRPAVLLSFIPATIEIIAVGLLAPIFFDITYLESFMMGAVVAAVSPAIVVPRMIELIKHQYGAKKRIPHLILASASIDDVFVIVVFMSLLRVYQGSSLSLISLVSIPLSLAMGILLGVILGLLHVTIFKKYHMRDTVKVLWIFSVSFLMVVLENYLNDIIPISGLIAVMTFGITIHQFYPMLAKRLHLKFEKIWVIAEMMLFVLVGAAVQIAFIPEIGIFAVILLLIALSFRMLAVWIALIKTKLSTKEKLFVALSYTPKATVQAAIGAIPLALGVPHGHLILSVAVLSIILTAPLGALLIDQSYQKLLSHDV